MCAITRALVQPCPGPPLLSTACLSSTVSTSRPLPVPWLSRALPWFGLALVQPVCAHPALPLYHFLTTDMVRTRGGSRLRPRVRLSTSKQAEQAPASATVPDPVPEEPQGFRRYRTRMRPGPLPQCLRHDPGGPGPPSGQVHQARGSPHHLGLSRRLPHQQQRRAHRPNYRLP